MPQRSSSRSAACSQRPESVREAALVDAVLRSRSLVPFEPEGLNDGVHCFFYAALDALRQVGLRRPQDMLRLRRDVKKCLHDHYSNFDRIGLIEQWLLDHPDINSIVQRAGDRRQPKHVKQAQWF